MQELLILSQTQSLSNPISFLTMAKNEKLEKITATK